MTEVVPAIRKQSGLPGRYPNSVQRSRVASQVRLLRLTRQFTQWAEDVLSGKLEATNNEKIAIADIVLKYTQPRMVLQESQVSGAAMTLATGDDAIKMMIARAVMGSLETAP